MSNNYETPSAASNLEKKIAFYRSQFVPALEDDAFATHEFGYKQYGTFMFNGSLVIGYGIVSAHCDGTSVFTFLSEADARDFSEYAGGWHEVPSVVNGTQVVCFTDYPNIIEQIPRDLRENISFSYSAL